MASVAIRTETPIKAAVIDRLFAGSHVDADSVIISEMTVASWSRRADIVLANGKLWAFEIKSDVDSLARLPGQIGTFQRYFEKFTIVAAERFESAILSMVPAGVGVWILGADGTIKQKIASRQSLLSKEAYISLMTATELKGLLVANGFQLQRNVQRAELVKGACGLSAFDLASAAREAVKRRHRTRHLEFIRLKNHVGTLSAMSTLRRPQQDRVLSPVLSAPLPDELEAIEVPTYHPQLIFAPSGPVLKRKRP